jgi:hypothetical protein
LAFSALQPFCSGAATNWIKPFSYIKAIMEYARWRLAASLYLPAVKPKRRNGMGEKGGKKDKEKAQKQKKSQIEKKKEQQKSKSPIKKPV